MTRNLTECKITEHTVNIVRVQLKACEELRINFINCSIPELISQ